MNNNKEDLFYIRATNQGYSGNAVFWLGLNNNGYVLDINKAQIYTYDEAIEIFNKNKSLVPYLKEDVLKATTLVVDSQYLNMDNSEFYTMLKKEINEEIELKKQKEKEENEKNYVEYELFNLMEVFFDEADKKHFKTFLEFSIILNNSKKNLENLPYYYPNIYSKDDKTIFDDLIKQKYIFKCSRCEEYHSCLSLEENPYDYDKTGSFCEECVSDITDEEYHKRFPLNLDEN